MDEDDFDDAVFAAVPMPNDRANDNCKQQGLNLQSASDSPSVGKGVNPQSDSLGSENLTSCASTKGSSSGAKGGSTSSILVNPRQRGNPVLKHIRKVPWEYSEIVPDYVVSVSTCALFLSVRYYNLHPDYIHERLKELKHSYALRVLLVLCDVPDPYPIMKTLTHISVLADLIILPCNTAEDAGRILEMYKVYETKPPDLIQEQHDDTILQQVIDALTSIRRVSKTDALTLFGVFGTLAKLVDAPVQSIALCPGIGPSKALRIYDALHEKYKNRDYD